MIALRSPQEIEIMKKSGKMLANALYETLAAVRPGVSEIELDQIAEHAILRQGGKPGFKLVPGYKHTICAATNEVVVHGIPSKYVLQEGDVICIDCGVYYEGFHTDMAETVRVGGGKAKSEEEKAIDLFLETGKIALEEGIAAAKGGNHIGDISKAIQDRVEGAGGYSVVRSLIGHGVGRELHEDPEVPGFLDRKIERTPLLKPGMTIAVEVIYNMGEPDVVYANNDGWTIKSADNSLSAVFERSILITEGNPIILTQ